MTHVPYTAFKNCTRLEKVTFSPSVTVIGNSAFSGCSTLKEVNLTEFIQTIDK